MVVKAPNLKDNPRNLLSHKQRIKKWRSEFYFSITKPNQTKPNQTEAQLTMVMAVRVCMLAVWLPASDC